MFPCFSLFIVSKVLEKIHILVISIRRARHSIVSKRCQPKISSENDAHSKGPFDEQEEELIEKEASPRMPRLSGFGGRLFSALFICLLLSIAMPVLVVAFFSVWQLLQSRTPLTALQSFAEREVIVKDLKCVEDLRVGDLHHYAQAVCVEGQEYESTKNALYSQLNRLPEIVRNNVVKSALVEGISVQNSVQDTKTNIETDGKASSYMAFWSTKFINQPSLVASAYSTCVLVTGVDLNIGEDLAGYEISEREQIIGTQPCHCGYLYCAKCPIRHKISTKSPVFKRHRMTLRNQQELHKWMVKKAVDQVRSLGKAQKMVVGEGLGGQNSGSLTAPAWSSSNELTYLGRPGDESNAS